MCVYTSSYTVISRRQHSETVSGEPVSLSSVTPRVALCEHLIALDHGWDEGEGVIR